MSIHDLHRLGGVGDGVTHDGPVLAAAAARCAAEGGGTIVVPRGTWLTGSVRLPSRTTLRLEAGARILGSRDFAHYPVREQPWEGGIVACPESLIWAGDAEDVAVVGEGTIDGQGDAWWSALRAGTISQRPRLLSFLSCRRVKVEGVRLTCSPSWTIHPWRCRDVRIAGVTILNPPDAPNTDGIDPESCSDVRISGCLIDVGDDAIVLKAGAAGPGARDLTPCERVTVTDCTLLHGHGGVVIGSEMSGGVRDVLVANCIMRGTDRGIRIKTRRGRGGSVENLSVHNVVMREVGCPLVINLYYRHTGLRREDIPWVASREPRAVDAGTPLVRNIRVSGLTAEDVTGPCLGFLLGLPERPVEGVSLRDCRLRHRPEADPAHAEPAMAVHLRAADYPTCGLYAADVAGLSLDGVDLRPRGGERLVTERCEVSGGG